MNKRNYGIDLLRIVAMFYVMIHHVLSQGGVLAGQLSVPNYMVSWVMRSLAACAVDCFGLISGYVCYRENNTRLKLSGYFTLWLQVVFYGLLLTFIYSFLLPGQVDGTSYIKAFLPVTFNLHWYFTAYTCLVLIMPLINAAVQKMEDNTLKKITILSILLFSVYLVYIVGFVDRFALKKGYSFVWLAILYFIGAVIKKTGLFTSISKRKAFILVILFTAFSVLWKTYASKVPVIGLYLSQVSFIIYIAPTVLGTAIIHLVLFARYNPSSKIIPAIKFMTSGVFAAYLINTQYYVWHDFMAYRFSFLCSKPTYYLIAVTFGFSAIFIIVSVVIDRLRQRLFQILRVDKIAIRAEMSINKLIEHFVSV